MHRQEIRLSENHPFFGLLDIDATPNFPSEGDIAFFEALGSKLIEFSLEKVIGACLLHTHFEVFENETIVSKEENGVIISWPSDDYSGQIEWVWRIGSNSHLTPIGFFKSPLNPPDLSNEIRTIIEKHISPLFISYGMANRFGLFLHHMIPEHEDLEMIESNNSITRRIFLCPGIQETGENIKYRQTTWRFEPLIEAATYCASKSVKVSTCATVSSYCKSKCKYTEGVSHDDIHRSKDYLFERHKKEYEYEDRHYQRRE